MERNEVIAKDEAETDEAAFTLAERRDIRIKLSTTLAPMLLAAAVFSITAAMALPIASKPITAILLTMATVAVFSASLIVDALLDEMAISAKDRLSYIGGGYVMFAVVVGAIVAAIPALYVAKNFAKIAQSFQPMYILFGLSGLSTTIKLMMYRDRGASFIAMMIFTGLGLYNIAFL